MAKSEVEIIKQIEAEFENTRPTVLSSKRSAFLNSGVKERLGGGGSGCGIVTTGPGTGSGANQILYFPDISSLSSPGQFLYDFSDTNIQNDTGLPTASFSGDGVARYGDKIWFGIWTGGVGGNDAIVELDFDESIPSASFNRVINYLPSVTPGFVLSARCGIDSSTVLCTTGTSSPNQLIKLDISGVNAIPVLPPIVTTGFAHYDAIYIPSSDTYLVSGQGNSLSHYDASGVFLDNVAIGSNSVALFCNNGDIYAYAQSALWTIDLTNYTATQLSSVAINQYMGDAASNPECCDGGVTPTTCYDIGDIGPEGGIIFSIPGVGPNTSTNMYYEVAQNDIDIAGTPNAGFNHICGGDITTITSYTANMTSLMMTNIPPNSSNINMTTANITGATNIFDINQLFLNQPPVSVAFYTAPPGTPGPVGGPGWISHLPPGTTLTSITGGSVNFSNSFINLSSYWTTIPQSANINFQGKGVFTGATVSTTGWSITGSEWGAYEIAPPAIQTLTDFGSGLDNTDNIDAFNQCPPPFACHPVMDTHDIAATKCKNHGTTNDWFLPSAIEFKEMIAQVGSLGTSQITLNSFGQNSEHIYWTSSQYKHNPLAPIQNPDKYSWAWDADTNSFKLAWRCHALSVRPIRSFECEPEPCPSPPDCNFEYNYRDGHCGHIEGSLCSGEGGGFAGYVLSTDWTTTNEGCDPGTTSMQGDSVMGGPDLGITLSKWDVLGNQYTTYDFDHGAGSSWNANYYISLWDVNYNFMGKWKYNLYNIIGFNPVSFGSYDNPGFGNWGKLYFDSPQLIEGDYPVIWYGANGSSTGVFFKIEWDGANGYETGCNSTIFGNPHPHNTPGTEEDWPFYCGPLYNQLTGNYTGVHRTIPRYATNQPVDLNGATLPVYPTALLANPNYNMLSWPPIASFQSMLDSGPCGGNIPITNHCWSICGVVVNGIWYAVPDPWFNVQPYGQIAMENNPLSTTPPPFALNPYVDQDFTDFYDWILTQAPTLAIGDSFIFDMPGYGLGVPVYGAVSKICFKYRGVHNYLQPLSIINDGYPLPNITHSPPYSCCVSGGSSSSSARPTEDNLDSIKFNVDRTFNPNVFQGLSSKRIEFLSEAGELDDFMIQNNIGPSLILPTEELPSIQLEQPEQQEIIQPEERVVIQPEQQERITPPEEPEEETPPPPRRDTGY